nr:ATP-dependent RNA helicase HrpA-like [Nerophis lumbriciformis]
MADVAASGAQRQACLHRKLEISFDQALPIAAKASEIGAAVKKHQLIVVAGETGSGKTTQLPKICLSVGRGVDGLIGVTQPRRIAARSIASRLCEELSSPLGGLVGYQVRFDEKVTSNTQVKLMTDGILLAETQQDRWLNQYDTIIIDEAHERSLNIDFLLGYLKQLLPRRPDLTVIVTSATIDTGRFSAHFSDAPVIEVSGRTWPVEMRYRPLIDSQGVAQDQAEAIAAAIGELNQIDPRGDVLVFLPGERDIRETQDFLSKQQLRNTEVLPLFARLSGKAQNQIFRPGPSRRVILATNVAETSLTVPRIKFVIDSGLARVSRYSHRSKVQRLPIESVSQASANQRAGRCGRLAPGTCIRLYDETDFDNRPEFTQPEIVRTNLATVILRMATLRLGSVEKFPFLDAPDQRLINDGYQLLFELGALDSSRRLTAVGKQMARWPLDVRLARVMIAATELACASDAVIVCAGLTIADPRERPLEAPQKADVAHAHWHDAESDFVALIKLWQDYQQARQSHTNRQLRQWCQQRYLNFLRMREWRDLQRQFSEQLASNGRNSEGHPAPSEDWDGKDRAKKYEALHRAIGAGFLGHVALRDQHEYLGARNRKLHIFPGSGLFKKGPKWMVSAFVVETTRVYARTNARIEPEWLEVTASHLLKRRVFDPFWSRRAGKALAYEQVTLFGLSIVNKRRVSFSEHDPVVARELFLLDGLTRGQVNTKGHFLKHNLALVAEIEELEVRQRKRDLLVDESEIAAWYDQHIPTEIVTVKALERWRVKTEPNHDGLLHLSKDDLLRTTLENSRELFPRQIKINGAKFQLGYLFQPGHVNDGVTIKVPLHLLNVADSGSLEWLVPGLVREKVVGLIRSLPKPLRRHFVPVPDCADRFLTQPEVAQGLHAALARFLAAESGQSVTESDFVLEQLAEYLRMNIHLRDGKALLAGGRDLGALQAEYGEQARDDFFEQAGDQFNRDGLVSWAFDQLPATLSLEGGMQAFPALVDQETAVGVRLFDTSEEAVGYHRAGLARLLRILLKDKFRYLARSLTFDAKTQLHFAAVGTWQTLRDDAIDAIGLALVDDHGASVRSADQFDALLLTARDRAGEHVNAVNQQLSASLATFYQLRRELESNDFQALFPWAYDDIQSQLGYLIYPGFVAEIGLARLDSYPRYFSAIAHRLEALQADPGRDQPRHRQVDSFWRQYLSKVQTAPETTDRLEPFRWQVEEYRVSLFAQRLKTAGPVSAKRLSRLWSQLTA